MTPLEHQAIIERVVRLETENSNFKESLKTLKTDFDQKFEKIEETLSKNHTETQKTIKDNAETNENTLKDILKKVEALEKLPVMGQGIYKFLAILGAVITFTLAVWKFKP